MKKTIGILAHVDAGKTTFSEQILYHTNSIRTRGRVDHKNTFLDNHNIERKRGITVFSSQGVFEYKGCEYYLVDTPGHVDFSTEMERAIAIMDYAIIIVSAVEGVQGHTETVWSLLRKYNIPTLFFINKIDRVGENLEGVLQEIKNNFNENILLFNSSDLKSLSNNTIEEIAELDENLLERYLEGEYSQEFWINSIRRLIKNCELFPCFSGSALQDKGIVEFLDWLDKITITNYENDGEFSGRVFKIRYDENGNRLTFIKAVTGKLRVKDEIEYRGVKEKVNSIRIYNGDKFISRDIAKAGDVFAVLGITNLQAGNVIGIVEGETILQTIPTLTSKVIFDKSLNIKEVLSIFKLLEAEDPSLNIIWNEILQELQVHIMGIIQLEVLKDVVSERFNLNIEFGPCNILYKETINSTVIGSGHFEPLKHYAEVHLKLDPAKRGTGIIFENKCHTDNLSYGNQNLIKTHIFERDHHGILTGYSITDIKVTLLTGRAHNKHTEGGDFREATFRALRQGLEKAQNILLEPYYKFKISVELDYMGRVLSDIQKFNGTFNPPEVFDNKVIINGRGPVSTFMNYSMDIIAFTKGKGAINLVFDGYDICHNESEVIDKIGYDKNADIEYTSSSIFCSRGQGYIVTWSEADKEMHCDI